MDKHDVARYLTEIDEQNMLDILQEVFENRRPWPPGESTENRYFLGIAARDMQYQRPVEFDPKDVAPDDREWNIIAVSYTDREEYPNGMYEDFGQYTVCKNCGYDLAATAKRAFCSICGTRNGLT